MKTSIGLDPRRQKILDYIRTKGFATPEELAVQHGVAAITVRRDFIFLEKKELLRRVHGGAIPCDAPLAISHVAGRMHTATDEKKAIAATAAALVQTGERLFIDAGSTCCFLAEALPEDQNIIVITHSLDCIRILAGKSGIHVVCLGGELDLRLNAFVGPIAEAAIQSFHVDKAFLSVTGVDLEAGCSINSLTEERIKSLMASHSRECYVLSDHSKFGKTGFRTVLPLSKVTAIVSDQGVPASCRKKFQKTSVRMLISNNTNKQ